MAGSSIPGSLGCGANQVVIDRGTSALTDMPVPGPVGMCAPVASTGATPKGGFRTMSAGEIAMSRLIFKDAVDYTKVKIHNKEYLWFGWQNNDTAMTPNGEMYWNSKHFKEDYSIEANGYKHWFIHEMVHVWQHQLGYPVKIDGLFSWMASYKSVLTPEKRLTDYGMEKQGDIIADYYAIKFLNDKEVLRNPQYAENLPLFEESVLVDFLADPSSKLNLPFAQKQNPSEN